MAFALLALVEIAGCQRRTRLDPAEGDSTAHVADTSAVAMRDAQQAWDAGGSDAAAEQSARLLVAEFNRRPSDEWAARASALLDSLGIGAELADGTCALVVSLFARSDPAAGSWPYIFWCEAKGVKNQKLEGQGLHLDRMVSRGLKAGEGRDSVRARGVAVLFGRRAGGGEQPMLMTWEWERKGQRWKLAQTLGADSLGGVGTGEFESPSDTTFDLVTRTYRASRYFDECASCPHVFHVVRFRWSGNGFRQVDNQIAPSTYSTFVQFIEALLANREDAAAQLVTEPVLVEQAHRLDWARAQGPWRIAPGIEEVHERLVFYRGQKDAFQVSFAQRGEAWLISGFEPVTRAVE